MTEQKYCDICAQIKKGSFKPSNPEMIFGSWADVCRNTLKIHKPTEEN